MTYLKTLFPIMIFLLHSLAVAEVFVSSSVDRNEMRPGDTFTLSVSIQSEGSVEISRPEWPQLTDFQAVNSWSGNEIQSVFENNRFITKRRQVFHLQLQALREGEFTVGPVRVEVDGRAMSSKPISIRVSQDAQPSASANDEEASSDPFGGGSIDDIFNQMLQNRLRRFQGGGQAGQAPSRVDPSVKPEEQVFISSIVDKRTVYEGEQVSVSYHLYTKAQISDIDTLSYPTLAGFWKEDIEVATRLNFQDEIVNGVPYKKALLASYALFPIKSGSAVIDPYLAKLTLMNFNPFGNSRTQVVNRKSRPIDVQVLPLPKEGRPSEFTGAVGDFTLRSSIDNKNPSVNQPLTLSLRFDGKGNAKMIELPKLKFPDGLELYDTQSDGKFFPNGTSHKEFKLLLIPRKNGQFSIEPFTIAFFSAEKKQYYSITSEGFELQVTGSSAIDPLAPSINALASNTKSAVQERGLPPLILKFQQPVRLEDRLKGWLWGGLYSLTALTLLVFARVELGRKEKRERLRSIVQNRLKKVEELYGKGEWRQAASETTNVIYFTLGELSEVGGGSEELEKMILKAPPSFRNQNKDKILRLMKVFETLAFAPEQMVGDLRQKQSFVQNLNEVRNILLAATELDFADEAS